MKFKQEHAVSDKILSFILVKADPVADEDLAVLGPLLGGGVLEKDDGLYPGPARTSLE